jgi:hypothetical protein
MYLQPVGKKQIEVMDKKSIDQLIDEATKEAFDFFNRPVFTRLLNKNNLAIPQPDEIRRLMNLKPEVYLRVQAKYKAKRQIDEAELINDLRNKANEYIDAKYSFSDETVINTINSLHQPTLNKAIKDYCYLCLWTLFVLNAIASQKTENKPKPEKNIKQIILKDKETIEKLHSELKGFFPKKEIEFLKALQGEQLSEKLLFPNNQNKFVEVFRRLKYNGFLLNNDTEIKKWISRTFCFEKKGYPEPQPFNENSVYDILSKGRGEPAKKQRICNTEWLPYKSHLQLTREAKTEKL